MSDRRRSPCSRGFTLIELLMVIAIIALLISILMPSLTSAREQGRVAKCLANLRSTMQFTLMYQESDSRRLIQWYRYSDTPPTGAIPGYGVTLYTPSVFGGFQAPVGLNDGYTSDAEVYPAQVRPLNAIVDPLAQDRAIIDLYKCPSDKSYTPTVIGDVPPDFDDEQSVTAWQGNGTSYNLNSRYLQGYTWPPGNWDVQNAPKYALRIAPHLVGGKAARFLTWMEQRFHTLTYRGGPTLAESQATPQRLGWHRMFSKHAGAFHDGHAEYKYFDTRVSIGDGWTTWEPK